MLLAVNIGNSTVSLGYFEEECVMVASFDVSSDIKKTSYEYFAIIKSIMREKGISTDSVDSAIISSVVPVLTSKIAKSITDLMGKEPMIVGPGVKTGFHIKIDNPSELGADMVANTAAAIQLKDKRSAAIVVDLGIVNTASAISKDGEYLGCAIFPGIQLSFDALHGQTAQLPNVNIGLNNRAIGKNSQSSLRSGVILGNALAIDGLVDRFMDEMRLTRDHIDLIATGDYAQVVLRNCNNHFTYEKDLTLKGLYFIYKNNL